MIDLASHIEYLLLSHDCVVVPGLGAFIVHEVPAYYDEATSRFMPPCRSLGFNSVVNINDGLLSESVARRHEMTIEHAYAEIEVAVSSFIHQLSSVGSLPIGDLGVISESDGIRSFEPFGSSVVTLRYSGLSPVDLSPIVEDTHDIEADVSTVRRPLTLSMPFRIVASVIFLLVVCGIFFTTNGLMGDRHSDYASLDSGLSVHVENMVVAQDVDTMAVSREIILNIAKPSEQEEKSRVDSKPSLQSSDRYLLVIGSFPSMRSALKFVGDDSRLSVIEMDNKFRVYAASAPTNLQANSIADTLRDEFPTVWICRR